MAALLVSYPDVLLAYKEDGDDKGFVVGASHEKALDYLASKHLNGPDALEAPDNPALLVDVGNLAAEFIEAKKKDDDWRLKTGKQVEKHAKIDALVKKYHCFKPRRIERHASKVFFAGGVSPYPPWFKGIKRGRLMQLIVMLR